MSFRDPILFWAGDAILFTDRPQAAVKVIVDGFPIVLIVDEADRISSHGGFDIQAALDRRISELVGTFF